MEGRQQGLFLTLYVTLMDPLVFTALAHFRGHKLIPAPSLYLKKSVAIRYKCLIFHPTRTMKVDTRWSNTCAPQECQTVFKQHSAEPL